MVIRKMPCASIWTHPKSLCTFHWKRTPSLPSILTGLWAEKALLKHLTLLLISISWSDDLVSVTWIADVLIRRVEGKVCLCYLPPPLPFRHYTAGFRATWGLDSDVHLALPKKHLWGFGEMFLNISYSIFFPFTLERNLSLMQKR